MTENKRFERVYADVDVFCRDHNAKGISQLIEKEDYDKIVDLLNHLHGENQRLSKDKQLAEAELMTYKQRVKDELELRYCLSNHKPVYEFMAKKLDITLEGNVE